MAGAGWKVFSAGAVLTAAEVNTYLMDQSVQVFAGTAARGSAIGTAASEGMQSYLADTNVLETYDGAKWVPSTSMTPTSLTGRNLLYNGAMQVAQRGTATSAGAVTGNGYYTADRWNVAVGTGAWTQTVATDAPTGSGFKNSLKMQCSTTGTPGTAGLVRVEQRIEGQDLQRVKKGTASAEQLTISFWVKSYQTGTFIIELLDADNSRQVSKSYTVSASATWEKQTVTFPADATGAFDNDNAASLYVNFWLLAGTDYTSGSLNTSWGSTTSANRAVGQTNVGSSTSNYWQVTGVQLEVGPVATPFEFEPFGDTLRKCQRYYYRTGGEGAYQFLAHGYGTSATNANMTTPFPVEMRGIPTSIDITTLSLYRMQSGSTQIDTPTAISLNTFCSGSNSGVVDVSRGSGFTNAGYFWLLGINSTSVYLGFSAEL